MSDRLSKATDEQLERALTRLGSGMEPPAGEGLLDRVEDELTGGTHGSRFNWRRLLVAALALTVAGAGALLAARAFGPDAASPGGEPTADASGPSPSGAIPSNTGFHSVFPELSRYEAETAQRSADAGDPEVQWRLDPDAVARRAVEDSGYRHPVATVELTTLGKDGSRIYDVTTEAGEVHEVDIEQLIRQGEGGIWSATGIRSRLVITLIDVNQDGATTVGGDGAPPGTRIGYHLHRACPPEFAGMCGYTDELRSVEAGPDGRFRIEDSYPGWIEEPGVFAVWVIEESNEGSRFGPITMQWLPSGEFPSDSFLGTCPNLQGTLPVGPETAAEAEAAVAATIEPPAFVAGSGPPEGFVASECGPEVAERTWQVEVDDGSNSASLDWWVYVVRRADGWEAWGNY